MSSTINNSGLISVSGRIHTDPACIPQQGKIIVPQEMNSIAQIQQAQLQQYPGTIISSEIISNDNIKLDGDTKRKRARSFVCQFSGCNKSFDSQWGLSRHIRTHTGERPFKCEIQGCNKTFTERSGLKRHMAHHTTVKPFKCLHPGCNKSFKSKTYLDSHRRLHEEEDPYKCTINDCQLVFSSMKSLKRHQSIWHNTDGKESSSEQILREKYLKLQRKQNERLAKLEKQLKDIIDSNNSLKKENALFRRQHGISVGRIPIAKRCLYEPEELIQSEESKGGMLIPGGNRIIPLSSDKPDIASSLFHNGLVEMDGLLSGNRDEEGSIILLPTLGSPNQSIRVPRNHLPSVQNSTQESMLI